MKNSTETTQAPKDLLKDLKSLVGEAETMTADSLSDHSSDATRDLRARFSAAQDRLADVYATTRKNVAAGAKITDTTIRENPYQSMAVAVGIGVLIGVLVGRRSK